MKRNIITEELSRIKSLMGLVSEVVDVNDNSYINMNIKQFPKYKQEISDLLKNKLESSNGDFVKFKDSVIVGYDQFKIPILSKDLQIDNRYLNYMISNGSKQFNSMLYSIFSNYYKLSTKDKNISSSTINCDPSNFKIIGPLVAQDDKSLMSYWVSQKGGRVYKIRLPEACAEQLDIKDRTTYVTFEPTENRIHFGKGVPEKLRGKKLGTLIYLAMIRKLGYITSSMGNSAEIKMVYQDILSNPKYENDVMSLLIQKQVLIFDRNTTEDVVQVFNDFVKNKFTDKKSVVISPSLRKVLGDEFENWYNSLEMNPEMSIDDKIKKYEGESPKGNDTVVDTKTGKIYTFNGEWEDKGKKLIQLMSDKFESLLLSADEKSRFKVIHRGT